MDIQGKNLTRHDSLLKTDERELFFRQRPATIWLTGFSGAGKSTVGFALEKALLDAGQACYVLDGDNVRHGLNKDLGFSPEARTENIRRIAEVAHLFNEAGLIVITAFISPYREDRTMAKSIIGEDRFVEVHLATELAVCEQRDPKGLYAKARTGVIKDFTGISAPYEVPLSPALSLDTSKLQVPDCVAQLMRHLQSDFLR